MLYICALTEYKQERWAEANLRRQRFDPFLPSYKGKRADGGYSIRLLFPGYIFVPIEDDRQWPTVLRTMGIKQVLVYQPYKQEYLRPNFVTIDALRSLAVPDEEGKQTRITAGCYVKIVSGTFAGHPGADRALVEWADQTKARLLVSIFNRQVSAEFYLEDLEYASSSSGPEQT